MNIPQDWKNVAITNSDDEPTEFDLVNNVMFKIVHNGTSDPSTSQGSSFQGTVSKVLIKGTHSSGRFFTITCEWNKRGDRKWTHSGVLHARGTSGGGAGAWTAEEGG